MIDLSWKLAPVLNGDAKPELLDTYTADRIPVIRNVLTLTEGLLSLNYRESPLSEHHSSPGSLKAGDRVPDLPSATP